MEYMFDRTREVLHVTVHATGLAVRGLYLTVLRSFLCDCTYNIGLAVDHFTVHETGYFYIFKKVT